MRPSGLCRPAPIVSPSFIRRAKPDAPPSSYTPCPPFNPTPNKNKTTNAGPAVAEARAALAALRPPPEVTAFQAAREAFDEVARHHPVLRGALETLINELGSRFMSQPRERLLAVVTALLTRCYKVRCAGVVAGVAAACFGGVWPFALGVWRCG